MHDGISEPQMNAPVCSIPFQLCSHNARDPAVSGECGSWGGCFPGGSGKGTASPRAHLCLSAPPSSLSYSFPRKGSLTCPASEARLWSTVPSPRAAGMAHPGKWPPGPLPGKERTAESGPRMVGLPEGGNNLPPQLLFPLKDLQNAQIVFSLMLTCAPLLHIYLKNTRKLETISLKNVPPC